MMASPAPPMGHTPPQRDGSGGPPWHALEPDATAVRLLTGPQGLSQDDARRRLERDGPNQLPETPPTSGPFVILLHQFSSPLI